ncbi:MAG: SPASM domain-containing protein, partial [Pseudomonadota bacterium]
MILAYMKPTNYCNVGCTHCYLPEIVRANKYRMSHDTLEKAAALIGDMVKAQRRDGALILWHGGEPLTVPVDWYYEAGEVLDRMLPKHMQALQTSLVPWRDEYKDWVIERCGREIGSSIDFSQRKIKGSVENYHKLWMMKVDQVRADDIRVLPGVVPTRHELGRERWLVNWFVEREFDVVNLDRYNAYQSYFNDRPSNLEHSYFLMGLFDAVMEQMEKTGTAPVIGAVKAGIMGVLFEAPGDRWGTTCQSDFVVVEPDGSLNNCPDKSTVEENYGTVEGGYKGFATNNFRRKWLRVQSYGHKRSHCQGCENSSWCHSGCPITPNGVPDGEVECSGYKTFLSHIRQFIANGREAELYAYLDLDLALQEKYSAA